MGTFENSENPDEMPENAAFHQDLHCLLRQNDLQRNKYNFFRSYNLWPTQYIQWNIPTSLSNFMEKAIG